MLDHIANKEIYAEYNIKSLFSNFIGFSNPKELNGLILSIFKYDILRPNCFLSIRIN